LFDSHCHLTDIPEPEQVFAEARRAGVRSVLCCGYNASSNEAVTALRDCIEDLPIAVGLHPWYANEPIQPVLDCIDRVGPVAIGECGLDGYDRDPEIPSLEQQLPVFEAQLDLAARRGLPVTVHSRKAVNQVIAALSHFPGVRGALHAYSGSYEQVRPLLERGWMIGIGGGATRPSARRIRRMAQKLELTEVLLETDAPAIGLEGVCPPWVRPHHVIDVAQAFAALRGVDYEELLDCTDRNAVRLFGDGIWGPSTG
jgi:TatD DNase family protein